MINFLFIHIPKCGGTSIVSATGYQHPHYPDKQQEHVGIAHYTEEIMRQATYTFSVVRNPLDRLVSWFFYHQGEELYLPGTPPVVNVYDSYTCFTDWFDDGAPTHWGHSPWRMLDWLTDNSGDVNLDDVFLLSDVISPDSPQWERIKIRTGTNMSEELPHAMRSEHKPYLEYYTPERKQKAMDMCSDDIAHFKFPGLY